MRRGDRLAGKVALVTGVGAGIGRGVALMFARQGAQVLGCDRDVAAAQETERQARSEGLSLHCSAPVDLTRPEQVQRWVEQALVQAQAMGQSGGFDIVVNAAAFGAFEWLEAMDYERHWRKTLTGEVDLVFLLCQAAWPHLKQRGGGSVINFASANAHMALPLSPALAHCAGKGAVLALSRQLAMEGAPHGIRVNTISPALIETAATAGPLATPGFREQVLSKLMLKRLGQPEDVAWLAVYLASDEASWVTAADYRMDGGATAW